MKISLLYFLLIISSLEKSILATDEPRVYQMSKQTQQNKSEVKMKAVLMQCPSESPNCQQNVTIKIWMNLPTPETDYHLIIDEIFDPKKQQTQKLINPYLVVLKAHEPILKYPLAFEKTIKSTCKNSLNENEIIKRSNINSNGKVLNFNGILNDFGKIKEHENDIKMSLNEYLYDKEMSAVTDGGDLLVYFDKTTEHGQHNNDNQIGFQHGLKNIPKCDCLCKQCTNIVGHEKCVCCNDCGHFNPLNPTSEAATATQHETPVNFNANKNRQENFVAPQSFTFKDRIYNRPQLERKIYAAAQPISYQKLNLANGYVNDGVGGSRNNYQTATATNNQNGFMMERQELRKLNEFQPLHNQNFDGKRMSLANYDDAINLADYNDQMKIDSVNEKPVVRHNEDWINRRLGENSNQNDYHLQNVLWNKNPYKNQYEYSQRPTPGSDSRKLKLHNLQRAQKLNNPAIMQGNGNNNDYENIDLNGNERDMSYSDGGEEAVLRGAHLDLNHQIDSRDDSGPLDIEDDPNWFANQWPRQLSKKPQPTQKFPSIHSSRRGKKSYDNFESLINNRNLTFNDKINLMNSLTANKKLDEKSNRVEHELDDSTVVVQPRHKRNAAFNEMTKSDDIQDNAKGNKEHANGLSQAENSQEHNKNLNRDGDGLSSEQNNVWYSIFNISDPIHYISTTIQLFRKQSSCWQPIIPATLISNLSGNIVNKCIAISISSRMNGQNGDESELQKMKLLVPGNSASTESLITLQKDKLEDFSQSICHEKRSVEKLKNVGRYPKTENVVGQCKDDPNEVCLNLVDERVNPFHLSIQVPFEENHMVDEHNSSVKISNIVIDASAGSNLHAQFTLMSLGQVAKYYDLILTRCPLLIHLNVSHGVEVLPNKQVIVDVDVHVSLFLERKEEKCEVELRNQSGATVAKREFLVKPQSRCLCLFICSCLCFDQFLTVESHDLCRKISTRNEYYAGFSTKKKDIWDWEENFEPDVTFWVVFGVVGLLLLLILMGCIKALLGCCFPSIGKWKYNYLQPNKIFREAGRCRKFFINLLFFLVFPLVCCCNCFSVKKDREDHSHGTDNAQWGRSIKQQEYYTASDSDDESSALLSSSRTSHRYAFDKLKTDTSETIFDINSDKSNDDPKSDTEFVVTAINKSRESLRTIQSHFSEESLPNNPKFERAKELVHCLLDAKTVYRKFSEHIGNVKLNVNQRYSIRGYFLPANHTGYQFLTYHPLIQYWEVSKEKSLTNIHPTITLDYKVFRKVYANKMEVLEANELSVIPTTSYPCINVRMQSEDMYEISSSSSTNLHS